MSQSFDLPPLPPPLPSPPQPPSEPQPSLPPPPSPPRLIEYGPLQGYIGDNFHIDLNTTIDPNLLKIAFDSCITSCHFTLNTVTQVITIHTIVPNYDLLANTNNSTKVPIYLIFQQLENILDSWFIGYFNYSLLEEIDEKTQYYPYVGLPPTQPSREYFDSNSSNLISTYYPPHPYNIMPLMDNTTNYPSTSTSILPDTQPTPVTPTTLPTLPSTTLIDPFANLLNKANLQIEGDLELMKKDWTPNESENQRRLVQFWKRQQGGNQVKCKFNFFTLPLEKSRPPDTSKLIIVSCIYWQEKNDYYITSVDCIYLLEHLIGVKFTVEEKNRIRRNLEGYKPLTVSKLKPESAEFFKLIMGFPNPKPRNIEKDLKVFPWSILGTALKKIISKYTASYSSTASVNYDA